MVCVPTISLIEELYSIRRQVLENLYKYCPPRDVIVKNLKSKFEKTKNMVL